MNTETEVTFDVEFEDAPPQHVAWWKKLPIISMFFRYEFGMFEDSKGVSDTAGEI